MLFRFFFYTNMNFALGTVFMILSGRMMVLCFFEWFLVGNVGDIISLGVCLGEFSI